ncbi:MAG: response regulator transcription factor [Firmicutes bacterium]|nr:response regulator transcription factor [Bacillota bacterium]
MIRIVIVDDQVILREGLKYIIESDSELCVVGCGGNGREALELCDQYQPDLVLMDIIMPEVDGVEGTRLIKAKYQQKIKVVILTTFNEEQYFIKAMANGADGYVLKDIKPEDLFRTIKSTVAGFSIIEENSLSSMIKQMNANREPLPAPKPASNRIELTEREKSVLRLIVDGKDNKEIAAELFLTEGSVRNVVSGILRRLELRDRIQLAIYAVKNELV